MKVLLLLLALIVPGLASSNTLNKIVIFGDSLSDNGNLYVYMDYLLPLSPPYYKGRFTNGPAWIELLTDLYYPHDGAAHLEDYAFGGAGVNENLDADPESADDGVFNLTHEIDTFLLAHQGVADDKSLYIVWIGANNYLNLPEDEAGTIEAVNTSIVRDIKRLVNAGATNIMVVNEPDLGKTPAAFDLDSEEVLTRLTLGHNARLQNEVLKLQAEYPSRTWLFFDVYAVLNDMLVSPGDYGMNNTRGTCYEELVPDEASDITLLTMSHTVKPSLAGPHACDGYLFFDPIHPSELAHKEMARRTKVMVDNAGIRFE